MDRVARTPGGSRRDARVPLALRARPRSGKRRRDDDDLIERARFSLRDAGDRAFGLNNLAAAASLYDDALGLWPEATRNGPSCCFDLPLRCTRPTTRRGRSMRSKLRVTPCSPSATPSAHPRPSRTSRASPGIAASTISSSSTSHAPKRSPATRSRSRRREFSPSPPGSERSRTKPRKVDVSPRPRSRWRRSSDSTSSAPMP